MSIFAESDSDTSLGQYVFSVFNSYMSKANNVQFSTAEISKAMGLTESALLDGVGFSFRIGLDLNESKLNDAMKTLADRSGGRIPSKATFDAAMNQSAQSYTFTEAATAVAAGTISKLGDEAAALGDNVLTVLKFSPFLLVAAAGAYFYFNFLKKK